MAGNERAPLGPGPISRVTTIADQGEGVVATAFDAYASKLKGFAYQATHDLDEAEDIVQEVFVRLVREVQAGRIPENVGGWLFRVASNLIVSRGRHRRVADRARQLLVDRGMGRSPEDTAVSREGDASLVRALAQMPVDWRVALLMAARGDSSAEIAAELTRSVPATRTLICRARLRLRSIIETDEATR